MSKQYHFIEARNAVLGNRLVLWSLGNYVYEIDDRTSGKTFVFEADIEQARKLFDEACASY